MIIDAPLNLPNEGPYYVLGNTDVTRQLVSIIEAVRPGARFCGYVDAAHQAKGAPLIVCDLRIDEAKNLLRAGETANAFIMPLPIGDHWSYWEFAKLIIDEIGFDGQTVTLRERAFTDLLLSTKRAVIDEESGGLEVTPIQYLSRNLEILLANEDKDSPRRRDPNRSSQPPSLQDRRYRIARGVSVVLPGPRVPLRPVFRTYRLRTLPHGDQRRGLRRSRDTVLRRKATRRCHRPQFRPAWPRLPQHLCGHVDGDRTTGLHRTSIRALAE